MELPVNPPVLPMLAQRVGALPDEGDYLFEPKWDGFRTLVFRDGDEIFLQSRDEKPLNRYFPELIEPLKAGLPSRCVLDGELVIARGWCARFRVAAAPRASRGLAGEALVPGNPGFHGFFDLLCEGDRDLRDEPFERRRERLEALSSAAAPPLILTPATRDRALAADWFARFEGAGFDGVMAKPTAGTYVPNKRVMLKVKHERDCDCVVAGFRWHKRATATRSVLSCSGSSTTRGTCIMSACVRPSRTRSGRSSWSFSRRIARTRSSSTRGRRGRARSPRAARTSACRAERAAGARARISPGSRFGRSSWWKWRTTTCRALRFRHTAQFRRFRTDKPIRDCTYAQLEVVPAQELAEIFGR